MSRPGYRSGRCPNAIRRRPNAFKHGAFSAAAILPGEDPNDFLKLHSGLIKEWKPDGATDEDAVLSLANAIWRKRRAQKFLEVRLLQKSFDPSHPGYDEKLALMSFATCISVEPETAFANYGRLLRPDKIEYLTSKYPRSSFNSVKWAEAIIREIHSVLIPKLMLRHPEDEQVSEFLQTAAAISDDDFKNEITLNERLDVMVDRAVKRLIQIKAMKQMLGSALSERELEAK
jgi:hypothetical protein